MYASKPKLSVWLLPLQPQRAARCHHRADRSQHGIGLGRQPRFVGLEQDARQRPVAARAEGDQLAGGDRGIGRHQHVTVAAEANEGHNITPVLALARGYPLHAVRQQQGKDTPSGGRSLLLPRTQLRQIVESVV